MSGAIEWSAKSIRISRRLTELWLVNRARTRIVVEYDLEAVNFINLDLRAVTLDIPRKRKCPGRSESLILEPFNLRERDVIRDLRKRLIINRRKFRSLETPRADFKETSDEGARTGVHGRGARSFQRTHNAVLRSGVLHEG